MRTFILLVLLGLALSLLLSADFASGRRQVKVHPRSLQRAQASGGNLANDDNNAVIDYDLGLYFMYYGNNFATTGENDAATPAAMKQWCTDMSDSAYMNIVTQYTGTSSSQVTSRKVHWVGEKIVGSPYGLTLGGSPATCILNVLDKILFNATLAIPFDPKNQYYLILGSDVTNLDDPSGCDDSGCGLHDSPSHKDVTYLASWVGSQASCIGNQVSQLLGPSPNENTQSAMDTLAHEVQETLTDPYQRPSSLRAWQDSEGAEISDKCTTDYGTVLPSTKISGAYYNVLANGNEYMVQGQWSNEISGCTLYRAIEGVTPSGTPKSDGSESSAPAASASNEASPSPTPSNFGALPTSACVTCNNPKCRRTTKLNRICVNKLGGTLTVSGGKACCNGVTKFKDFYWSVYSVDCEYGAPGRKLTDLCTALGGRVSCSIGTEGAVRITCHRAT